MNPKSLKHLSDSYLCCTKAYKGELELLKRTARESLVHLMHVTKNDVRQIEMELELEKLQRNADSLIMLLSMAQDASTYIRNGINNIIAAEDEFQRNEARKFEKQKERILKSQEYKEKNDKHRHKIAEKE